MYQNFPLQWPIGYERNPPEKRIDSQFKQSMDTAQYFLKRQVELLGGKELIVSTNLRTRLTGGIYAEDLKRLIDDPGVAIYFEYYGEEKSLCCDKFRRVWENIYALGKGIEAIRGLDRWGISEFIQRAFVGFPALPPPNEGPNCWQILGLKSKPDSVVDVDKAFRNLAKTAHPDGGGSSEKFDDLYEAYRQAKSFF